MRAKTEQPMKEPREQTEEERIYPILVNPNTGRHFAKTSIAGATITPKVEQAIRLYATGKFSNMKEAAAAARVSETRLNALMNTPAGQAIVDRIRGELDFKYQSLYRKFIEVVESALEHPDPGVALAGASLFAKTQIGTKVKVDLSAEDIVQQIMNGTYRDPNVE